MMRVLLLVIASLFLGCSATYVPHATVKEYNTYKQASTAQYALASDDVTAHYPKSGFYPLAHYYDAFLARLELIRRAKERIDVQYFIFSNDEASVVFADELIKAADRGVKVRILVDDLLLKYRDKATASIAAHKNIEIKLFNPTRFRGTLGWLNMGLHISKYGRRMHNKMLIVDNSALVIGGRNIENIYFGVDQNDVFIDNDILAIGPIVAEASNKFETYWSFKRSVDVHELYKGKHFTREELDAIDFTPFYNFKKSAYFKDMQRRKLYHHFQKQSIPLYYANARLYSDLPTKIVTPESNSSTHLTTRVGGLHSIKHSLVIINPYVVPNEEFMKEIKQWRDAGIEISILTNSLATNDAIPVYAEYSKYHKALLQLGVHLYEVKPNAVEYIFKSHEYTKLKAPKTSLHAKTMIIDGKYFVIGSFNLDPRSRNLNTEAIAVIESEALSRFERRLFDYFTLPENSYTLRLEKHQKKRCVATCGVEETFDIVWESTEDGNSVKMRNNDAGAGFFRRLASNLLHYIDLGNHI